MLAPDEFLGDNQGCYEPNEHIGHFRKELAAKLAPLVDNQILSGMLFTIKFECFVHDSDTTHHRC